MTQPVCGECNGTCVDPVFGGGCDACTTRRVQRTCPECAGSTRSTWDANEACIWCDGRGWVRSSGWAGHATQERAVEYGTGTGSTQVCTAPARTTWGWAKHDGEWVALAPIGTDVTEGPVTLVTAAGKESEVWVTGRVLARMRYGLLVEVGTAPKAPDAPKAEQPATTPATTAGLDLTSVPSGTYMIPGNSARVQIDNLTKGKWAGWVFVKDGSEYGHGGERRGSQKPGQSYRGTWDAMLAEIAADPRAAAAEFGHRTGRCCVCSRTLEDPTSLELGIGPICIKKF